MRKRPPRNCILQPLPELKTAYEEALERPIMMDEDTFTMLAHETWSTVEKYLEIAADADLEAAQRVACAALCQELVGQNQAPRLSVYAEDRQVEGVPMRKP